MAIIRFLIAGGLNTGLTFVLYWALLLIMSYRPAYAISFAAGIIFSYFVNTRFVFKTTHNLRKLVLFPLVYLFTYCVGAFVLQISIARFNVDPRAAPFISICATLPLTYLLTKLVLTGRNASESAQKSAASNKAKV